MFFSFGSCNKNTKEWTIIYGELNDNLAYTEVNGNVYYDNIEYFFINNKTKQCYRLIDTNQLSLANDLIQSKLSELTKKTTDVLLYKPARLTAFNNEYINIEFNDKEKREMLYKINITDTLNDNVFVFSKYKSDYLEMMWTDRKSKIRKTKKFNIKQVDLIAR